MYFKGHFRLVMCHPDNNKMTTVGMKLEESDCMYGIGKHIQLCYRKKSCIFSWKTNKQTYFLEIYNNKADKSVYACQILKVL